MRINRHHRKRTRLAREAILSVLLARREALLWEAARSGLPPRMAVLAQPRLDLVLQNMRPIGSHIRLFR